MRVIDVDSHLMEPFNWLEEHFPDLADRLPPLDAMARLQARAADDMMDAVPRAQRVAATAARETSDEPHAPRFREHLVVMREMDREHALDYVSTLTGADADVGNKIVDALHAFGGWRGDERVQVLDEMGIDFQFALHGGHEPYVRAMKQGDVGLALESLAAGNTWAAEVLDGHLDRISPVTLVDLADLEWSITEIRRNRALGSRMVQVRTDPVDGTSIAHPDFDRFWAAVTDLGMVAMIHVGASSPLIDPGWSNHAQDQHHTTLLYFSQNAQVAQVALAGMIFGGLFDRHPALHVVVAELGYEWVPAWIENMDQLARPAGAVANLLGSYQFELLPSEFMQRQVHVAAIANHIERLGKTFAATPPGVLSFSSDYPHPEGQGKAAMRKYADALDGFDRDAVATFYSSGTLEQFLAASA